MIDRVLEDEGARAAVEPDQPADRGGGGAAGGEGGAAGPGAHGLLCAAGHGEGRSVIVSKTRSPFLTQVAQSAGEQQAPEPRAAGGASAYLSLRICCSTKVMIRAERPRRAILAALWGGGGEAELGEPRGRGHDRGCGRSSGWCGRSRGLRRSTSTRRRCSSRTWRGANVRADGDRRALRGGVRGACGRCVRGTVSRARRSDGGVQRGSAAGVVGRAGLRRSIASSRRRTWRSTWRCSG
jgi:hypothetical protein